MELTKDVHSKGDSRLCLWAAPLEADTVLKGYLGTGLTSEETEQPHLPKGVAWFSAFMENLHTANDGMLGRNLRIHTTVYFYLLITI